MFYGEFGGRELNIRNKIIDIIFMLYFEWRLCVRQIECHICFFIDSLVGIIVHHLVNYIFQILNSMTCDVSERIDETLPIA